MTSIAILPATAVSATGMPSYVTPGGAPSSAKAKRCKPAGAPSIAFGTGSAQSGSQRFAFALDGAPPGATYDGAPIALTAIAGSIAIEVVTRLD